MERTLGNNRMSQKRRKIRRLAAQPTAVCTIHAVYEPVWAAAWPHLDDWFKIYTTLNRSLNL